MEIYINLSEFKLLTHLHEHHCGVGRLFPFDARETCAALGFTRPEFLKAVSYLDEHGLAGLNLLHPEGAAAEVGSLWLSGAGEDYLRAIEQTPSIAKKLTVALVLKTWDMGRGEVVSLARSLLPRYMHRSAAA